MNNFIFNPIKYQERFYWTFKEVLTGNLTPGADFLYNCESIYPILETMISEDGYSTPIWDSLNDEIKVDYRGVLDLVVKRHLDHYCFYTESNEFNTEKAKNFIAKLIQVLEMTAPRYLTILKAYKDSQNALLDPVRISNSGITRFNDTPQDEGDFANDEHTTNLTEDTRTTENDMDSKMGRIREIERSYSNILLNWSNEFEGLFIEESNI